MILQLRYVLSCRYCEAQIDSFGQGFFAKLRLHLFPRVVDRLLQEARRLPEEYPDALSVLEQLNQSVDRDIPEKILSAIYIHSDRLYRHGIAQINFTTYDCRQDQDTLNASTSRRDIMCLREESPFSDLDSPAASSGQPPEPKRFSYARILGIFHANVVYGGPGMLDHIPQRFDFLWVRWYRHHHPQSPESTIWSSKRLETVSLVPLADPLACDFVDPSNVIRAAHIIPRFSLAKRHEEALPGQIFSKLAGDEGDWKEYYVNP